MEKYAFVLVALWCLVRAVWSAVPQVEVTKTASGNCSQSRAKDGDVITVHYEGTFDNGTIFDSSFARNEPFIFDLGDPGLIKGWNMAVQGVCVGDMLNVKIPYSLGYGEAGRPPIPPRTDLNYKIDVLLISDDSPAAGARSTNTSSTSDDEDGDDGWDDEDDDNEDEGGNPTQHRSSRLVYQLQFLAIPVAVLLFVFVAYCIYTIEYPDRKIRFYRVSDHDGDMGGSGNRVV